MVTANVLMLMNSVWYLCQVHYPSPLAAIKAPEDVMASYMQLLSNIQENTPVQLEDLEKVCTLSHVIISTEGSLKSKRKFHEVLANYVQQIITSPVITLLDFETVWKESVPVKEDDKNYPDREFPAMMELFKSTHSSQVQYTS